ncbi:MAG: alpha/beta hydrolase [Candidatus Heimdallarchaeota archaeon]|nr:alpha/beta hydrolase [Candidatus Heimdallarchaeota archaeon]
MKKWLKISLVVFSILVVLSGSLVIFVIIPVVGKNTMLHPDHEAMYIYPHELNMNYENVTFTTSDGLDLSGWFIEPKNVSDPNSNITLIVLHGATHSKAWMLDHYGEGFYNNGYRLLFFDSRNRGESPDTALGLTWGIDEVKDIRAAVDYVKNQPEVNNSNVFIFAESQGAATLLFYTSRYNDVAGIIADSSWGYGDKMIKQAYPVRSGFPWVVFGQITIKMMESHYGYTFSAISPAINATDIVIPTYIIHGNDDIDIDPNCSTTIYNAIPATTTKLLWRVDDRAHVESYLELDYFLRIAQFILNAL